MSEEKSYARDWPPENVFLAFVYQSLYDAWPEMKHRIHVGAICAEPSHVGCKSFYTYATPSFRLHAHDMQKLAKSAAQDVKSKIQAHVVSSTLKYDLLIYVEQDKDKPDHISLAASATAHGLKPPQS